MQLIEEKKEVTLTQPLTQSAFRIDQEQVAHILSLLSSKLYSNKIKTAVTELCSNAYDAHVAAGKADEPFEIDLPNYFNPVFRIKDSGISMTEEDVRNIYASVGFSTKRNTDEQVGCFGIGKISVLGVTDSYVLICRKNGIQNTYSVYLDEDNLPQIAHLGAEPTSETGVEISFAVKKYEEANFASALVEAVQFYKVKPIIRGKDLQIPKFEYLFEGDGFGIPKTQMNQYGSTNRAFVVMGQQSYPITPENLNNLSQDQGRLLATGIHLFVKLGAVGVTPTREALSYTPRTINFIKAKLDEVMNAIQPVLDAKFNDCDNIWDAKKLWHNIFKIGSTLANLTPTAINWKGQKITNADFRATHGISFFSYNFDLGSAKLKAGETSYIYAREDTTVVWNNINGNRRQVGAHVRGLLLDGKCKNVICINYLAEADKDTFISTNSFEGVPASLVSNLPIIRRPRGTVINKSSKHSKKVFVYNDNTKWIRNSDFWDIEEIDLDTDTGVYVIIDSFKFQNNGRGYEKPEALETILKSLETLNLEPDFVYGFKSSVTDKIGGGFKTLWVYAKEEVEKILKQEALEQRFADRQEAQRVSSNLLKVEEKNVIDSNSPLIALLKTQKEMLNEVDAKRLDEIYSISCALGIQFRDLTPRVDLQKEISNVSSRYPLLRHLSSWEVENSMDEVIEYVNLVDGK